jgi:hypothetical protein
LNARMHEVRGSDNAPSPQRHVVRQLVDFGAWKHVQINIDIFGPSAPQVRRFVEPDIAAVIDRRQTLIGIFGIVDAVVTMPARHQRRDHHL